MSRHQDLEEELRLWQRRLQKLKKQKATFGAIADPSLDIQIEDIEATINKLQAELRDLEQPRAHSTTPQPQAVSLPAFTVGEPDPEQASLRAKPRLFLCHASQDKERVKELYHLLKEAGYRPWLDKFDLLPGQRWRPAIKTIVTDPNNLVLVCLSNNSITKQGVIQQEIKWALDILEQIPQDAIYLIPVRLETCQAPEQLSELHWVDLFELEGFEYLTRALDYELRQRQARVEPKPVTTPPPTDKPLTQSKEPEPVVKTPTAKPNLREDYEQQKPTTFSKTPALDDEIEKRQATPEPEPAPPVKPPPSRPPEIKQPPTSDEITKTSPNLIQKLLKLSRDPIWQTIGVMVGIIGVAWAIYTFNAGGNDSGTPTITPNRLAAIVASSPTNTPTATNTPPATNTRVPPTNTSVPPTDTPLPTPVVLPTYTPITGSLPQTKTSTDGAPQVLVPAGPFTMGSDNGEVDEAPAHTVTLDAFYIDQYEVTNARYKSCVNAGECQEPGCSDRYGNPDKKNHPVVCVTWSQARTYCEWRGDRLPTEAEWEKAARGTDERTYPWGENINCELANYKSSCVGDTTPGGSYVNGVSPYGVYDLAGNVWEWVQSVYQAYPYDPVDGRENLDSTNVRVLRGGGWRSSELLARASYRDLDRPGTGDDDLGFRCVASAPE